MRRDVLIGSLVLLLGTGLTLPTQATMPAKAPDRGTLRVVVRGAGPYTISGRAVTRTGRVGRIMPLEVGTYTITAAGARVDRPTVKVRDSKTTTVRITFPPPRSRNGVSIVSSDSEGFQVGRASKAPVWSPDGSRIAFTSTAKTLQRKRSNGLANVYVKDLTTGKTRLISRRRGVLSRLGAAEEPAWSPDGKSLAFTGVSIHNSQAHRQILVATLATGRVQVVSTASSGSAGNDHSHTAVWSPDGQRIAFTSYGTNLVSGDTNARADLFVKDLTGGAVQRVSTGIDGTQITTPDYPFESAWSPDGKEIAFISMDGDLVPGAGPQCTGVYVRELASGSIRCLLAPVESSTLHAADGRLSWSPDGNRLAFGAWIAPADRTGDGSGVVVVDLAAGTMQRIAPDGPTLSLDAFAKDPNWSPDGTQLAYVMAGPGTPGYTGQVIVEDLASGTTVRLGTAPAGRSPGAWSPDGKSLAFSTSTALLPGDTNRVIDIYAVTVR